MSGGSIWASMEGEYSHIVRYDTNPPAIQKQHWNSIEAQIEPPLIECEWAFRIRAYVSLNCNRAKIYVKSKLSVLYKELQLFSPPFP
jgi:hypothetical protein